MATYSETRKINKDTTSTPIALILGFSQLGNLTASVPNILNSNCLLFQNRPTIESVIDSEPKSLQLIGNYFLCSNNELNINEASIDNYVKEQYWGSSFSPIHLTNIDFSLIQISQTLSKEQIDLEDDFKEALNELMFSKLGNKPTKKDFR